jgi:hypothetical protein
VSRAARRCCRSPRLEAAQGPARPSPDSHHPHLLTPALLSHPHPPLASCAILLDELDGYVGLRRGIAMGQ